MINYSEDASRQYHIQVAKGEGPLCDSAGRPEAVCEDRRVS